MTEYFDNRIEEYFSNEDKAFLDKLNDEIDLRGFNLDAELDSQDEELGKNEFFNSLISVNKSEARELYLKYFSIVLDENQDFELRRKYMQAISAFQKISKNK